MGRHVYTQEEIDFLAANAAGCSLRELTGMFNARFGLQKSARLIGYVLARRNIIHRGQKYTEEQISFLAENVALYSQRELTQKFNEHFGVQKTVIQIGSVIKYYNLHGRRFYTDEQIAFLAENAKGQSVRDLTDMFNERFNTQKKLYNIYEVLRSRKFDYGGKKERAHHVSPVGTEKIRKNGLTFIKVSEDPPIWRAKHLLIWEAANGAIPKGYFVIFADGNKQNFDMENLILVSHREMKVLYFNGLRQENSELTKTGVIITDIIIKVSERRKELYTQNLSRSKTCRECGAVFDNDEFMIYCSGSCRDNAHKAQQIQPKQYTRIDRRPYMHCIVCGKSIIQGDSGRIRKYCSRACQRIRYKILNSQS